MNQVRQPLARLTVRNPFKAFSLYKTSPFSQGDALPHALHRFLYGGTSLRVIRARCDANQLQKCLVVDGTEWDVWDSLSVGDTKLCIPSCAGNAGDVRIFYEDGSNTIQYRASADGGSTFGPAVAIGARPAGIGDFVSLAADSTTDVYLAGYGGESYRYLNIYRNRYQGTWSGWVKVHRNILWSGQSSFPVPMMFVANGLIVYQPSLEGPPYRMWVGGSDAIPILKLDEAGGDSYIWVTHLGYYSGRWYLTGVNLLSYSSPFNFISVSSDGEHWSLDRQCFLGETSIGAAYVELGDQAYYSGAQSTYRAAIAAPTVIGQGGANGIVSFSVTQPYRGLSSATVTVANGDGTWNNHANLVCGGELKLEGGYRYYNQQSHGWVSEYETILKGYIDTIAVDTQLGSRQCQITARDCGKALEQYRADRSWLWYSQHKFYDDFSSAGKFAIMSGDAQVESGYLKGTKPGDTVVFLASRRTRWTQAQCRFRIDHADHQAGLIFWGTDADNYFAARYGAGDILDIISVVGGVKTRKAWAAPGWSAGQEYDLRVRATCDAVTVWGKAATAAQWVQWLTWDVSLPVPEDGYVGLLFSLNYSESTLVEAMEDAPPRTGLVEIAPNGKSLLVLADTAQPYWERGSLVVEDEYIGYDHHHSESFEAVHAGGTLIRGQYGTTATSHAAGVEVRQLHRMLVANSAGFSASGYVEIDGEYICYGSKHDASNALLCEQEGYRGVGGTAVAAHAAGATVRQRRTFVRSRPAVPVTDTDTTIVLDDASGFADSGTISVGDELVTYTSKMGNALLGCTRGASGTMAAHHPAGASTTTTAEVGGTDTTVTVASTAGFAGQGLVRINGEYISYTARDDTHLYNCIRGVDTPVGYYTGGSWGAHPVGSEVVQYTEYVYQHQPEAVRFAEVSYCDNTPERTLEWLLRELCTLAGVTSFKTYDDFGDDFSRGIIDPDKWDLAGATGSWSVSDDYGRYKLKNTAEGVILTRRFQRMNLVLRFNFIVDGDYADVLLRHNGNTETPGGIRIRFDRANSRITVRELPSTDIEQTAYTFETNTPYYVTISLQGDWLSVWLSTNAYGQSLVISTHHAFAPASGYIGVGARPLAWFDDFEVDELDEVCEVALLDPQETVLAAWERVVRERPIMLYFDYQGRVRAGYFTERENAGTARDQLIMAQHTRDDRSIITRGRCWGAEVLGEHISPADVRAYGLVFALLDDPDSMSYVDCVRFAKMKMDQALRQAEQYEFTGAWWPHVEPEDLLHVTNVMDGVDDDFIVQSIEVTGDASPTLDMRLGLVVWREAL